MTEAIHKEGKQVAASCWNIRGEEIGMMEPPRKQPHPITPTGNPLSRQPLHNHLTVKTGIARLVAFLAILILCSCKEAPRTPLSQSGAVAEVLASLTDPAHPEPVRGKGRAIQRLRQICYWLEMEGREGKDEKKLIESAQRLNGSYGSERARMLAESLARNRSILEHLGCLDEAGMGKLRTGNAPTITKGPYAGELATGDHIIPRSVSPALDNVLLNLEFMPETLNHRKGAQVGEAQVALARQFHAAGIIDSGELEAIKAAGEP